MITGHLLYHIINQIIELRDKFTLEQTSQTKSQQMSEI